MMLSLFVVGLLMVAFAIPAEGDGPLLSHPWVRRRLWQAGLALSGFVIVVGDFHAGGLAAFTLMITGFVVAIGVLFWLDRGRFDASHTRRSMAWYFRWSGPGGWPMGGHRLMALVSVAVLFSLLLLRPVARGLLGLDSGEGDGFATSALLLVGYS